MDGRCLRCWAPKNLVSHEVDANPRADPTVRREKVVLCKHCADGAPLDALLFWEVYMRFGSTREMLQHYVAETEEEALQKLCTERHLNEREVLRRARGLQNVEALNNAVKKANAFLTYASPYGYDYVDANILSNPVYCGLARLNGGIKRGKHDPLIEIDTFNRVQQEMQRRIRRPDQRKADPPQLRLEDYVA
ncbi:MAG: hypothetical protein E6K09_07880 [Methanobacteriota archaeon]|nr:MAG: hypothetical protein E6K09_07880 [Euryarchaeota archaeon]